MKTCRNCNNRIGWWRWLFVAVCKPCLAEPWDVY